MNVWVRSQDRTELICSNRVYVENSKIYADAGYPDSDGCNWVKLGEYKSKERAIKVLDEIQNLIRIYNYTSYFYEMPEE